MSKVEYEKMTELERLEYHIKKRDEAFVKMLWYGALLVMILILEALMKIFN